MAMDWRSKVEALFAKANAQGTTQEESQALQEKAMYLMNKFGIEEAELRMRNGKVERPISVTFLLGSPYSTRKADLLGMTAAFLGGQAVAKPGRTINRMYIVGFKDDIERIKLLYHSLLAQMHIDMYGAVTPKGENTRTYRNAFSAGYVVKISERMQAIKKKISDEPGTDIVLFDRSKKVEDVVHEIFDIAGDKPSTTVTVSSRSGFDAGVSAAQRADLGQGKISR